MAETADQPITDTGINHAIQTRDAANPAVIESRERRALMRHYFNNECIRLGLVREASTRDISKPGRIEMPIRPVNGYGNTVADSRSRLSNMASAGRPGGTATGRIEGLPMNHIDYDLAEAAYGSQAPTNEKILAVYGGYMSRDDNSRAESGTNIIRFNEKWLTMPWQEAQRVISHELQHILNRNNAVVSEKQYPEEDNFLFMLHPQYKMIMERMQNVYQKYKSAGYKFEKEVKQSNWDNLYDPKNYCDPDELLALLRGYEAYIKQANELRAAAVGEAGIRQQLGGQPYEFIEAFEEGDLDLLDPAYRHKISEEIKKAHPDVIEQIRKRNEPSEDIIVDIDL